MAKTLREVLDELKAWGRSWKNQASTAPPPTEVPFTVPAEVCDDTTDTST